MGRIILLVLGSCVLIASLACNFALLRSQNRNSASTASGEVTIRRDVGASGNAQRQATEGAMDWNADFATIRETLRAMGFSDDLVRGVLSSLVARRLDERRVRILFPNGKPAPWEGSSKLTPDQMAALGKLSAERLALMKEAFGELGEFESLEAQYRREARYGAMPMEKVAKLEALLNEYGSVQDKAADVSGKIDHGAARAINEELEKDIKALLTPGEYEHFRKYGSPSAERLKLELSVVAVTRDEYDKLLAIQSETKERISQQQLRTGTNHGIDGLVFEQQAAFRRILGDDRFYDFIRANDTFIAGGGSPGTVDGGSGMRAFDFMSKTQFLSVWEQVSQARAATMEIASRNANAQVQDVGAEVGSIAAQLEQKIISEIGQGGYERLSGTFLHRWIVGQKSKVPGP